MRYRIYDNVDKKYIAEEHAKHFFCLDIYGKVVKYNLVLGLMETGDRYTVEFSTGLKDICEGDKINVPIRRTDGRRENNIHHTKHSTLFLEMEVLKFKNGAFPLKKNEEKYKQLCEPMGRERVRQDINYPSTISDLIDWYDFEKVEIIGNIHGGKDER